MSNKITPFTMFKRSNGNYRVESKVANILKMIKKKKMTLAGAQKNRIDLEVAQKNNMTLAVAQKNRMDLAAAQKNKKVHIRSGVHNRLNVYL